MVIHTKSHKTYLSFNPNIYQIGTLLNWHSISEHFFIIWIAKVVAMKKRTFLKLTSTMMTGAAFVNLSSCTNNSDKSNEVIKNWAGNLTYGTTSIYEPSTAAEVVDLVKKLSKFRVLGTRHCFNQIADSNDNLISSKRFNKIIRIDKQKRQVTVEGGIRYGELCRAIDKEGFAIANLASLPHISVAGACATATHGSGVKNGNLATSVAVIEFITPEGEIVTLSRDQDGDKFLASVVSLGCLGFVSKITLDLIPSFSVMQEVYLNLPLARLEDHFAEIMSAGYSVSLFTDWQTDSINQVWIKRQGSSAAPAAPKEFFGATLATRNVHPIIEISAENCTEQMSVAGPWYDRLPHFKMDFTPSSGEELQAEYFVSISNAVAALKDVYSLSKQIGPLLMISEIRTIAADHFWMSPCFEQNSVAIHFTLKQDTPGVLDLLPLIEQKLEKYSVRPHWGKLFTTRTADLQSRYPKHSEFIKLAKSFDPRGKLENNFVKNFIYA